MEREEGFRRRRWVLMRAAGRKGAAQGSKLNGEKLPPYKLALDGAGDA